jgi:uncharacterized protein (DUF488 family)
MIEYVFMNSNEEELWEIDYETKIALNISELNIVKEKVVNYPRTIEDYLREKGFTEVHFHERGTLPSRAHYGNVQNCSFR